MAKPAIKVAEVAADNAIHNALVARQKLIPGLKGSEVVVKLHETGSFMTVTDTV
jgi:hypothetical protein